MSAVALFPTSLRIAEEEKDSSTMKKIPWWFPFPWDILVPLEASDLYKWYHWLFWRISTTQKSILSWSQHRKPSLWSSQWQGERSRLVPFWTVSYVRRLLNWCEEDVNQLLYFDCLLCMKFTSISTKHMYPCLRKCV